KIDMRDLPQPDIKKGGKEFWSGKALFSAILPKNLSMTFKSSIAPKGDIGLKELKEEDSLVVIKNGVIASGTIDENAIGAFKGKIVDKLARDSGPEAAREFIDRATTMTIGAIMIRSQMAGSIGQQAVRGERLSRGYWNRTLPHFKKGDLGAEAKGFVKSSYKSGLHPTEYFFHAMGGREGLVDTAVRTSRSG